jgi:hypothetical protein
MGVGVYFTFLELSSGLLALCVRVFGETKRTKRTLRIKDTVQIQSVAGRTPDKGWQGGTFSRVYPVVA